MPTLLRRRRSKQRSSGSVSRPPRIHDLVGLHRLLPESVQSLFDNGDLEVLNPWTIGGRYPADLPDSDHSVIEETLAAARRVLGASAADPAGDV